MSNLFSLNMILTKFVFHYDIGNHALHRKEPLQTNLQYFPSAFLASLYCGIDCFPFSAGFVQGLSSL